MSNRLIDLQHITKIYDDNTVLDDLNLYICLLYTSPSPRD